MKKSHHIRSRVASRFFKAAKFSEGQARPLNRLVTLNLTHAACPEQSASSAVAALVGKYSRWLRYQSRKAETAGHPGFGPPIYGTVLEAPKGIHHVHWLLHLPPELEDLFKKTLPTWLQKTAGVIHKPNGSINIKPIETVMALSRYCMKGVEKHHARRCYVKPVDQGVVWGKRVMISRSLGAKARATASLATAPGKPCVPSLASPAGSMAAPGWTASPNSVQKIGYTGGMRPAGSPGFHTPGAQLGSNTS